MMYIFKWELAICKFADRESATYYPVNQIISINNSDGSEKGRVLFDAYGRAVGEPYFGFPRLPYDQISDSDNGVIYKCFENTDNVKSVVFKRTGEFVDLEDPDDMTDFINNTILENHNVDAGSHQD